MCELSKEEMIDELVKVCPQLQSIWQEHLLENDGEPLYWCVMGEFARAIIVLHQNQERVKLHRLFEVIENLQLKGDDDVKNATVIGLLEGLQNLALHQKLALEEFNQYLLPRTEHNWQQLITFWQTGKIIENI